MISEYSDLINKVRTEPLFDLYESFGHFDKEEFRNELPDALIDRLLRDIYQLPAASEVNTSLHWGLKLLKKINAPATFEKKASLSTALQERLVTRIKNLTNMDAHCEVVWTKNALEELGSGLDKDTRDKVKHAVVKGAIRSIEASDNPVSQGPSREWINSTLFVLGASTNEMTLAETFLDVAVGHEKIRKLAKADKTLEGMMLSVYFGLQPDR